MIKKVLNALLSILIIFNFFSLSLSAQETLPNPINLTIPRVSIGDQRYAAEFDGNSSWVYNGSLSDEDLIRFGWSNKQIDLNCRDNIVVNCGYVKVYLNDDSTEENLITDFGQSPLPVNSIKDRLIPGLNRIMIVFVEPGDEFSTSKAMLSFKYKTDKERAQISVLEPSKGSLFIEDKKVNGGVKFKIELKNFVLNSDTEDLSSGQLKVYLNEVKGKPLFTARNSRQLGIGTHIVEFTSGDFDPDAVIPDSKNSTLFFVLAKSDGENLDTIATRDVITNYGQTLTDIGIPEIYITDPKNDRVSLNVNGDRKFLLDIKNFEILPELEEGENEPGKGYLQIFIDDRVIQTNWGKNEFTLDEIQYSGAENGRQTLRAQLVNKDFTRLTPETSASVDFIYVNDEDKSNIGDDEINVDNTNWRLLFIGIIVLTVLIGITILIFKG